MTLTTVTTLDIDAFDYVRKLVHDHSSIVLEATKGYLVESRLAPLARKRGLPSLNDLVQLLRTTPHGELHDQVVDAMTTNETSFFRDIHPFDALRTAILPELIERRLTHRTLNIWSAACSSGQEPYSIGIIIREHFPQLDTWNVRIHATDLSQDMLQYAATGCFTQSEANRGLPAPLLVKYFQRDGLHWAVNRRVRDLIVFRRMNLTGDWSLLPTMDVIFMRNVLIYFAMDTKRRILDRAFKQLASDGALFLGGAETTLGVHEQFERVTYGKTTIYRPSSVPAAVLATK